MLMQVIIAIRIDVIKTIIKIVIEIVTITAMNLITIMLKIIMLKREIK